MVFYESPHRILKCLSELAAVIPERKIAIARELTKIYEEYIFGAPAEVAKILTDKPEKQRGEFVVIVSPIWYTFNMIKQSFISGIILVILPILGIPGQWKTYVYVIIGLALIARFIFEKWSFFSKFFGQKPNISVESNTEVKS